MSVVIPGSEKAKQRATLEAKREMKISIRSLDRTFDGTGSLYHWKTPVMEERHSLDAALKQREEKRAHQLALAKAKHYKRTSFVWASEKYPAEDGPFNEPLISGFGLGSTENGFPNKPFGKLFVKAAASGLTAQPHAGEEWCDGQSCFNILDAIEAGATRISHGIHALATPSSGLPDQVSKDLVKYGCNTLAELMKQQDVVAEVRIRMGVAWLWR